jgi:hypothetical protein
MFRVFRGDLPAARRGQSWKECLRLLPLLALAAVSPAIAALVAAVVFAYLLLLAVVVLIGTLQATISRSQSDSAAISAGEAVPTGAG